jgi:glyoxylase-like metal-dependent hydrolase (beta-lactamase superfamily II)
MPLPARCPDPAPLPAVHRMLRTLLADNASAMTLDGTRTHIIGVRQAVVIDPGPRLESHLSAIETVLSTGDVPAGDVTIALTHEHPDHAAGAESLAARLGCAVLSGARRTLHDGTVIPTDAGPLTAVHTPGHTPDHFAFHWPAADAVFCGDVMMGGIDTALVASPEGDLDDYLASLERLRALRPAVIHPAHGPDFHDPGAAIDRYIAHRESRQQQVLAALGGGGARDVDALVATVYGGGLDPALGAYLGSTLLAYLERLERLGRVRRLAGGGWAAIA